jgi:hypothetical protein
VFVTAGDEYEISHKLEGTSYSSGQTEERVPGVVINCPDSMLDTDIPSFSSRTFVHAGVISEDSPEARLIVVRHDVVELADGTPMANSMLTMLHLLGLDQNRLWFLHNGRNEKLTDFGGGVINEMLA